MSDDAPAVPAADEPLVSKGRGRHFQSIWLVPIVAALIGLSMLLHAWWSQGPEIAITFRTASGLEAGKTPVKYKDVVIGAVQSVALDEDGSSVRVGISLVKSAARLARRDSRFWVVRPRIGMGGVSGIDTLLSGAYISADMGTNDATSSTFTGLETPPVLVARSPGRTFTLSAEDLGSLDVDSPIYYRRIQVGQIISYEFADDGKSVKLKVFVQAPYDRFVTADTRFWNAGGVDVSLGADGLKLKTQSIATIVAGGIAFGAPASSNAAPASADAEFVLNNDQETAMAPPDGPGEYLQLRFEQSLRGLSVGAPVQFSGVDMGRVTSITLDYDAHGQRFRTVVDAMIYPKRLERVTTGLPGSKGTRQGQTQQILRGMVEHGLRAQARPGNLLTGQLYIALDFMPHAAKVAFNPEARPLTVPTVNGSFDQLQEQLASIVGKLDKLPLESIGGHLDSSLSQLDQTLGRLRTQSLPQAEGVLQQAQQTFIAIKGLLADDAPLPQSVDQTLLEVRRAARSLRSLGDTLDRHPESLLRGLPADSAPDVAPNAPVANPPGSRQPGVQP